MTRATGHLVLQLPTFPLGLVQGRTQKESDPSITGMKNAESWFTLDGSKFVI